MENGMKKKSRNQPHCHCHCTDQKIGATTRNALCVDIFSDTETTKVPKGVPKNLKTYFFHEKQARGAPHPMGAAII